MCVLGGGVIVCRINNPIHVVPLVEVLTVAGGLTEKGELGGGISFVESTTLSMLYH